MEETNAYRFPEKHQQQHMNTIPGLTKTEFTKCPFRIVTTDLLIFESDIFKRKSIITNFISLCDNIDAILNFPAMFQTYILLFRAVESAIMAKSENSEI